MSNSSCWVFCNKPVAEQECQLAADKLHLLTLYPKLQHTKKGCVELHSLPHLVLHSIMLMNADSLLFQEGCVAKRKSEQTNKYIDSIVKNH